MAQLQASTVVSTVTTTGTSPLFITSASSAAYFGGLSIRESSTEKARFAANSTEGGYIYSPNASWIGFTILNDSSTFLKITSGGNVGIGTASPSSILQLLPGPSTATNAAYQSFQAGGFGVLFRNAYDAYITFNTTYSPAGWVNKYDTYKSGVMQITDGIFSIDLGTATGAGVASGLTQRFVITNGGSVGIGTTSPTAPLQINGAGGDGAPTLRLISATSDTFNWSTDARYANLATGETAIHLIGKANSTYNQAYFGYRHVSDGSTSNMITLGMYASDYLVNIIGNGNVGIGVTNPAYKLQVNGTGYFNETLFVNGITTIEDRMVSIYDMFTGNPVSELEASTTVPGNINFQGVTAQGAGATATTQQGITWQVNNYGGTTNYGIQAQLVVGNNGNVGTFMGLFTSDNYGAAPVERLRIQYNGNVGIGTTNPVGKLDVRAGSGRIIFGSYDANYYAAFESGDQLNFYNGASNAVAYINYNGPSAVLLGRNLYVEGNSGGGVTGAVRIKSDGNVGIGTATPRKELDVQGNNLCVVAGQLILGEDAYLTSANYIGLKTSFQSGTNDYMILSGKSDGATYVSAKAGSSVFIRSGGNTSAAQIEVTDTYARTYSNLGVGTAPSQALDVAGTIYSLDSGTDGGQIRVQNSGGGNAWYWAARTTGLNLGQLGVADGRIFVNNSGNVGIGITNPDTKLNVLVGAGGSNGTVGLKIGGTSNYASLELGIEGNYDGQIRTYGNDLHLYAGHWRTVGSTASEDHAIRFFTSKTSSANWSTAKMILTADGNVGIGSTSPSRKLDVVGNARIGDNTSQQAHAALQVSAGQGSVTTYRDIDMCGSWAAGEGHAITANYSTGVDNIVGQIVFQHDSPGSRIKFGRIYDSGNQSTYPMNLVSNGSGANLGIGTDSPARRLDVREGNVQIVANFQSTSTTSSRIKFTDANTGAENVNIGATGTSLAMWTNNTVRMTILSGGNVGIGTVTPTQRLQVEGAIVGGAAGSSGTPNLTGVTTQLAFEARTTTAGNEPSIAYHREGDYTFYLQGQETPRGLRLYGPSNEATPSLFVAGNVGIGTTAPTHKLDVRGSLRVDSTTSFTTEYGAVPNAIIGNQQDEKCLGTPDEWLAINVSGTDYAVPLFSLG
jgi:hypothetical protein